MSRRQITQQKILNFLEDNPGVSSTFIAKHIGLTHVGAYLNLKELLKNESIYITGNRKSTRYFKNKDHTLSFKSLEFYDSIKEELLNEYDGLDKLDVRLLLNDIISNLDPHGIWTYGLRALDKKFTKENNNLFLRDNALKERTVDFLSTYIEEESKRRKNGFFSGTNTLKQVLSKHDTEVYIDNLYFSSIATLLHFPSVGRLRGADEVYWGKVSQSRRLLNSAIIKGVDNMSTYLSTNNITHVIFTPPTIQRKVQFANVLKLALLNSGVSFNEIIAEKKSSIAITLRPQKETKGNDRIINAKSSILVRKVPIELNIPEIVIFDDNFSTGATINAIAEKIRNQGYKGRITAITLTGNFHYVPGVTDQGDV